MAATSSRSRPGTRAESPTPGRPRAIRSSAEPPPLRHQREDYLLKALRDYKAERRLGDRAAMVEVVAPLGDDDLADLAHYLAHVRE